MMVPRRRCVSFRDRCAHGFDLVVAGEIGDRRESTTAGGLDVSDNGPHRFGVATMDDDGSSSLASQRELAEAVGVKEATLTHHLNSMDAEGLITRQRDTTNRRIHVVELTDAGEATFRRLRTTAMSFDRRLRAGITEREVADLEGVLDRLVRNVASDSPRHWAGLLEANP
jgi:DNA-binding MarR family transcriptional regulator